MHQVQMSLDMCAEVLHMWMRFGKCRLISTLPLFDFADLLGGLVEASRAAS